MMASEGSSAGTHRRRRPRSTTGTSSEPITPVIWKNMTSMPATTGAAADRRRDRREPGDEHVERRRLQAHVGRHLPGEAVGPDAGRWTALAARGRAAASVRVPRIVHAHSAMAKGSRMPVAEQRRTPAELARVDLDVRDRHDDARGDRADAAEQGGVRRGHGGHAGAEVPLDHGRHQHVRDRERDADEHGAEPEVERRARGGAPDRAGGEQQQRPQHDPRVAEALAEVVRERRDERPGDERHGREHAEGGAADARGRRRSGRAAARCR